MACALDALGEEHEAPIVKSVWWAAPALSLAGGAMGALLWRKHRILGLLGASALVGNIHAVATHQRSWKDATRRFAKQGCAIGGALAVKSYPVSGYLAGAVAGEILLRGEGHREWIPFGASSPEPVEIIDVTPRAGWVEHERA